MHAINWDFFLRMFKNDSNIDQADPLVCLIGLDTQRRKIEDHRLAKATWSTKYTWNGTSETMQDAQSAGFFSIRASIIRADAY